MAPLMEISPATIFLVLLLSSSWSPRISATRNSIKSLPGFQGPLPFHLETGYVSIDERDDVHLFYYFIQSERNPREDPVLLWLSGGPRCSSFSGLAYEIGPLHFKDAEKNDYIPTLILNSNSWTKVANIIFLDAPVGSGFSYSKTSQALEVSDTTSAQGTCIFLMKWLMEHPEFISNQLYFGGDSYSGFIVPIIVGELIKGIESGKVPLKNVKGYILGNPCTNRHMEENAYIPYAHGMGLISTELYESLKRTCKGEFVNYDKSSIECSRDHKAFIECISHINFQHILEPSCYTSPFEEKRRSLATIRKLLIPNSILPENCRGAGHQAPEFMPKECFAMFTRWISYNPL